MKKILLAFASLLLPFLVSAQCTTSNATSCSCKDGTTNCDLLPDVIVGRPPLQATGTYGCIEYPQVCPTGCSGNDGRLRISVSTPNIGFGPLEVQAQNTIICGTDTFVNPASGFTCPNGEPLKQLIKQRIYHKNGNTMTYYDRPAGSMTYHPTHGHMHVDEWGNYSLRTATADPNPLNWPIVGTGAKLAFCLMDYGSCSGYNGHCVDSAGNTLVNSSFPNYGLGGGAYNCSPTVQGITAGNTDIYYQYLDGMWINLPPSLCNGTYYIVVELDPKNYFLESNENNNVIAVPITLTQQGGVTPTISANGPTSFCQGSSVTLTASPAVSYLWSNGATTQSITVNQSGSYVVTVNNITSCASTSSPTVVTVTPMSINASANNTAVCPGAPVALSVSATGKGSLIQENTFSNSTQTSIPDNNTTGISSVIAVSGINPATLNASSVVSVTVNIQHSYDSDLILKLVSPSGATVLLSNRRGGSSSNYTGTIFTGTATQTILQGTAPFTGSYRPEGSLGAFTGNINGNWTLKVADVFSGSTGRLNSWSLKVNNVIPTSLNYSWTSNPVGLNSNSTNVNVNPTATTTYTVQVSESPAGCSGSANVTVNVGNTLNVTTNTPSAICAGNQTTLTASGAVNYSWSPATGLSATSGASVVASPATTTTYQVIGTDGFCSDTAFVTVQVNALPIISFTNSSPICEGDSATITASGADTYSWSAAAGLSSTSGASVKAAPTSTTTYTVTGTSNGCSAQAQTTVQVNAIPAITLNTDTTICAGQTLELLAGGAASYVWNADASLDTLAGNIVHATPGSSTTYTVTGTSNGCSASAFVNVFVNTIPNSPGSIMGAFNFCAPANGKSFNVWPVANALSYTWTSAVGSSIVSGQGTSDVIIDFPTALNGSVCITANNGCGSSAPTCANILINDAVPAQPGSVTGTGKACAGSSINYTISPVANATGYNWTMPVGATVTAGAGTNAITVLFNNSFVGGNMSVEAINACGNSAKRWKTISWNTPTTPSVISGLAYGVCNSTRIYSVTNVAGLTYQWTVPAGATIVSGQGTRLVSVQFGPTFSSGNISVVAVNNCGSSTPRTKAIKAVTNQPGSITGPTSVCTNQTGLNYSIAAVTGATSYLWTIPSGFSLVSGQGTNSVVLNAGANASTSNLNVKAVNSCGNSAGRVLAVTIASCAKVEDKTGLSELSLSPNPANNKTVISFNCNNTKPSKLHLNNMLGMQLYTLDLLPNNGYNKVELDVRRFPAGVYLVVLEQEESKIVQRLIIQ